MVNQNLKKQKKAKKPSLLSLEITINENLNKDD
jgi:hypothetical protein